MQRSRCSRNPPCAHDLCEMNRSNVLTFVVLAVFAGTFHLTFTLECRDLHQRKMEIMECCSAPHIIETDGLKECFGDKDSREMFGCTFKCLLEKQGLMNGDEVNEEKLLEKIDSFEGEWKDTAAGMLKECKGKMQEIKARMAEKGPMREDCNPSAAILSVCIGKQTLEKCPANKWNDSELCDLVRSGKCEPMRRGGPH